MCGRFHFSRDTADELMIAVLNSMEKRFPGQYKTGEIFPGDPAPGVISRQDRIVSVPAVFGFPGFQGSGLLINARSETAAVKKTFAESLQDRRIILPATGFYEWSHDARKQKYLFRVEDQQSLYLCGIYKVIDGVIRFVILTRDANDSMLDVHHRMPVIISPRQVRPYLTDRSAAMDLIAEAAPDLVKQAV